MGYTTPTPIQQQAIPPIMDGSDVIACAQTGTGKTAAYLLPVLHHMLTRNLDHRFINALIIAPTRELAQQIDQQVEGLAYFAGVSSFAVYGGGDGSDFVRQKRALTEGADIIVATPGKLLSHLNLGYVKVQQLQHLILDEADKMLDMGFYDDIMRIIAHLPKNRQTLLFSATMPPKIRELTKRIMHKPVQINIAIAKPAEGILQAAYMTYDRQKLPLIQFLLKDKPLKSVLVFAGKKTEVKAVSAALRKMGLKAADIQSDLAQEDREEVLRNFKNRNLQVLVATDVLSRGIDIEDIDLVINYDVPHNAEDYVHRIGRTARGENGTGVAITFINEKDQRRFHSIEQLIEKEVQKLPLPPKLGTSFEYNPNAKPAAGGGRFAKNRQGDKRNPKARKQGDNNRSSDGKAPRPPQNEG
ncbi:ATP-dependent RNA helicase [Sphingobacteriales bacterium UPWRP_1]|nr:ATP-dependent RNA helicase [Sphingobacteriales bacterium UPWRP_1]